MMERVSGTGVKGASRQMPPTPTPTGGPPPLDGETHGLRGVAVQDDRCPDAVALVKEGGACQGEAVTREHLIDLQIPVWIKLDVPLRGINVHREDVRPLVHQSYPECIQPIPERGQRDERGIFLNTRVYFIDQSGVLRGAKLCASLERNTLVTISDGPNEVLEELWSEVLDPEDVPQHKRPRSGGGLLIEILDGVNHRTERTIEVLEDRAKRIESQVEALDGDLDAEKIEEYQGTLQKLHKACGYIRATLRDTQRVFHQLRDEENFEDNFPVSFLEYAPSDDPTTPQDESKEDAKTSWLARIGKKVAVQEETTAWLRDKAGELLERYGRIHDDFMTHIKQREQASAEHREAQIKHWSAIGKAFIPFTVALGFSQSYPTLNAHPELWWLTALSLTIPPLVLFVQRRRNR